MQRYSDDADNDARLVAQVHFIYSCCTACCFYLLVCMRVLTSAGDIFNGCKFCQCCWPLCAYVCAADVRKLFFPFSGKIFYTYCCRFFRSPALCVANTRCHLYIMCYCTMYMPRVFCSLVYECRRMNHFVRSVFVTHGILAFYPIHAYCFLHIEEIFVCVYFPFSCFFFVYSGFLHFHRISLFFWRAAMGNWMPRCLCSFMEN